MYNSQEIANRIKLMAKQQGKSVDELLESCKLGKNTVYKINRGADILTLNFAKIADYLNCSIDYLLGRTDVPYVTLEAKDEMEIEMLKEFKSLNFSDKIEIMNTIIEKTKK